MSNRFSLLVFVARPLAHSLQLLSVSLRLTRNSLRLLCGSAVKVRAHFHRRASLYLFDADNEMRLLGKKVCVLVGVSVLLRVSVALW